MNLARLVRFQDDGKETIGSLSLYGEDGTKELMNCKTLELPWLQNQHEISCIPQGRYLCTFNKGQGRINYPHFDVQNVSGRAGIKIHVGNYYTDIRGCILVGVAHLDINGDGEKDVTSSRKTLDKLVQLAGNKFELIIL